MKPTFEEHSSESRLNLTIAFGATPRLLEPAGGDQGRSTTPEVRDVQRGAHSGGSVAPPVYTVAVSTSRRTAAKRAAGSRSVSPVTAPADELGPAEGKRSKFNAGAVTRDFETPQGHMYREFQSPPCSGNWFARNRPFARNSESGVELCA